MGYKDFVLAAAAEMSFEGGYVKIGVELDLSMEIGGGGGRTILASPRVELI